VPNSTTHPARRVRRGPIAAALAAGLITVVVGSLDTAAKAAPEAPAQQQEFVGTAGGRLTFR